MLDAEMKMGARLGLVQKKRKAEAISFDDEKVLWENGAFGQSNATQLLNSLIYFFGIHFSLRACQEHKDLEYGQNSQLTLKINKDGKEYLEYIERMSKNRRYGLKSARMEPKSTCLFSNDDSTKCPIMLYRSYIDHRPENNNLKGHSAFYLSPIHKPNGNCWFKASPFGIHSIQRATAVITKSIHIDGFVSNTSLRRTSQNRLLQAGFPSEIIEKKTGRISSTATAAYVSSKDYERDMSLSLHCPTSSSYTKEDYVKTVSVKSNVEITEENKVFKFNYTNGDKSIVFSLPL